MAPILILAIGLAAAVAVDVRTRRIPNRLTATMALTGLGLAIGGGPVTPAQALLGMAAGLLLMLPGHVIGASGAGDVKLMAAVGALTGPGTVGWAFLYSAVAGGVLAVVVAAHRGILASTLESAGQLVTAPADARTAITGAPRASRFAFAPAIAAGTAAALLLR